jgi:hypothetical protein
MISVLVDLISDRPQCFEDSGGGTMESHTCKHGCGSIVTRRLTFDDGLANEGVGGGARGW